MKFVAKKEQLQGHLLRVHGASEPKVMPILANLLVSVLDGVVTIMATDLEIQLKTSFQLNGPSSDGSITVPTKKLVDIVKSLPEASDVTFTLKGDKVIVSSGRSRFTLSTLPADQFPVIQMESTDLSVELEASSISNLVKQTSYAMAQQDVRYYLNGMLFELEGNKLTTVATDGHRLAMASAELKSAVDQTKQVIIPRKGILEVSKTLPDVGGDIAMTVSNNHVQLEIDGFVFISKLVEGKFPDYKRVIPSKNKKILVADVNELKNILRRASILSNDKYKGVRLLLKPDELEVMAQNAEQEQSDDLIAVEYTDEPMEIGFNVVYLMDALNNLSEDQVSIKFNAANDSIIINDLAMTGSAEHVCMPMKL